MAGDAYRTVTMAPLLGIFDARSPVDQMPPGAYSWKQNFEASPDGKLQQAHGFVKPYGSLTDSNGNPCAYKNWDFHIQDDVREPITLLFRSTDNDRVRRQILATKTRIFLLNESTGVWSRLQNGLGNDGSSNLTALRFKADELQNKVVFTNDFDPPLYYDLSAGTIGTDFDFGAISFTKARVVVQWQGVIFFMNVVEDGDRYASRIRWSDLNKPTSFDTSDEDSISDYQDLDYGEEILNAIPLLGSLYVFTNQSIWQCNFLISTSDGTATLSCRKIYTEPKNQDKCLAYPNTLVSTGFEMYYAGRDAIYEFDPYQVQPVRVEWIYRASSMIFDPGDRQIDSGSCQSPVAEYWPDRKEIHFSWPVVDAYENNPNNCETPTPVVSSGLNRHTLVLNIQHMTCDYRDYGTTAFLNFRSDVNANASCNQSIVFLGANSQDFCIKQFGLGFAREYYDVDTETYTKAGYFPILRGVFPFGKFDGDKSIKIFTIDGMADKDAGNVFRGRFGSSWKIVNPNSLDTESCGVVWRRFGDKPIKCNDTMASGQYAVSNVRPSNDFSWNFLLRGHFLYFEITIAKVNGSAPTDGGVFLSRFEVKAVALS